MDRLQHYQRPNLWLCRNASYLIPAVARDDHLIICIHGHHLISFQLIWSGAPTHCTVENLVTYGEIHSKTGHKTKIFKKTQNGQCHLSQCHILHVICCQFYRGKYLPTTSAVIFPVCSEQLRNGKDD